MAGDDLFSVYASHTPLPMVWSISETLFPFREVISESHQGVDRGACLLPRTHPSLAELHLS